MANQKRPHLTSADRLEGSLIIAFEDGRCGIYSSELLYATLAQAKELHEKDVEQTGAHHAAESAHISNLDIRVRDTAQNR